MLIKYLILNYNMPTETDEIYNKLLSDGINKNDIFIIDNGSDKAPKSKNTTVFVEKNEFAPSGYRAGFDYVLKNAPTDYYVMITLSARLLGTVNYKKGVEKTISDAKKQIPNFSYITISFDADDDDYINEESNNKDNIIWYEKNSTPVFVIYNHNYVKNMKSKNRGWYLKQPSRGHLNTDDQNLYCDEINMPWAKSYITKYIWVINQTYKKGMATESRENYDSNSYIEKVKYFKQKYGIFYKTKILFKRIKAIAKLKKSYPNLSIGEDYGTTKLKYKVLTNIIKTFWIFK